MIMIIASLGTGCEQFGCPRDYSINGVEIHYGEFPIFYHKNTNHSGWAHVFGTPRAVL